MIEISVIAEGLAGLRSGETHDPHAILGRRVTGDTVELRLWRPGANSVELLSDPPVALAEIASGIFSADVGASSAPIAARYRAVDGDGIQRVFVDPYGFLPTLGELDLHLIAEGRHEDLGLVMGAREVELEAVIGIAFSVWAPSARSVAVVGDFNGWDDYRHPMRSLGASGIWEVFIPEASVGDCYKFSVLGADGARREKADPGAHQVEVPPRTASVVAPRPAHRWGDQAYLGQSRTPHRDAMSIYEMHLSSWRRHDDGRSLGYRELADVLPAYLSDLGFTHVEFMPVMAHPFDGSWGYQTTGYFAPHAPLGTPDELRLLIDRLHQADIGVILDWAPAHFARDAWALDHFDGTALYEHADPLRGEHPDWGTKVFNHGRTEVRNFLTASAWYWLGQYHADGLRVDAVASMLYRDYSRKAGEWVPGPDGGREDHDAVEFLRDLNRVTHRRRPGAIMAAEESTAWPGVSRPIELGGLGFGMKWNMGWMHDTLDYFQRDPVHRVHHHSQLTFGLLYAFSENFILPLSHDEVVHGKGSLLSKMPGDPWQRFANLRALYGHMWAHPGKKLIFMGSELAQLDEWSHEGQLPWHLSADRNHAGMSNLVRDLNRVYRAHPPLYERDSEPSGFAWLDGDEAAANVLAYARFADDDVVVCVANLSPVPRDGFRVALPTGGAWREILNTDSTSYGGSGVGNLGRVEAQATPWRGREWSASVTLPPLGVLWLAPETS